MNEIVKLACETTVQTLPVAHILATRQINRWTKSTVRFRRIASSIREVGIVEPLMVHRHTVAANQFLLLDGHLRLAALKDLGVESVECLVALDDEAFTYNHKVNRLSAIQEHFMILKAIERGVSEKELAEALSLHITSIRRKRVLLAGICPEAVELLRGKRAHQGTFAALRKVKPMRQIEISELMIGANNYTASYAHCLAAASPPDQLVDKASGKQVVGLKPSDIARMEREMQSLEKDFRRIESTHGTNTLHLVIVVGYLRKLLANARMHEFLKQQFPDMQYELEQLVEARSLDPQEQKSPE